MRPQHIEQKSGKKRQRGRGKNQKVMNSTHEDPRMVGLVRTSSGRGKKRKRKEEADNRMKTGRKRKAKDKRERKGPADVYAKNTERQVSHVRRAGTGTSPADPGGSWERRKKKNNSRRTGKGVTDRGRRSRRNVGRKKKKKGQR